MSLRHTGKLTGANLNAAVGLVRDRRRKRRLKEKLEEPRRVGGERRKQRSPTAAAAATTSCRSRRACHTAGSSFTYSIGGCACAPPFPLTRSVTARDRRMKELEWAKCLMGRREEKKEGGKGHRRVGGSSDSRLQGEAEMKETGEERGEDG